MRVEDRYRKDASAGDFNKFAVEVEITVTADYMNEEEKLIEAAQRIQEAVDAEVSSIESDFKKPTAD